MSRVVLLVDDEPDVRAVLRVSLERVGGWAVLEADGGEAGIDVATRERPDAIVLDVMMPGTDGPTTYRRLAADERTTAIPVVMLTARVERDERQAWLDMGVRAVFAKPFDPLRLPAELAAVLGWQA